MSKRTIWKLVVFSALLLICGSAFAVTTSNATPGVCTNLQAGGLFDDVVQNFHSGTNTWLKNAENYAKDIFWALAGIEFAWSAITWVLRKNSMGEYVTSLFLKLMSISFFFWVITYAPTWIPLVLEGFQQLATGVTQGSSGAVSIPTVAGMNGMISPSAVMDSGMCIITTINQTSPYWGLSQLGNAVLFALAAFFSMAIIAIAYCIITLQLVLTEVEAFIVLFGGLVMLGFTGSRWTAPWGEKYFGYAVSVGVKLMVIYLVISLGNTIILTKIINIINAANAAGGGQGVLDLNGFAEIIMMTLVYAGLAWNLPSLAGSFLNGSPNMSMGNMAGPAMAAGGAALGTTALAGGLTGNAVGAVAKGMQAGGGGPSGAWAGGAGSGIGGGGSGSSSGPDPLAKISQRAQEAQKPNPQIQAMIAKASRESGFGVPPGGGSSYSSGAAGSASSAATTNAGSNGTGSATAGATANSTASTGSNANANNMSAESVPDTGLGSTVQSMGQSGGQNAFNDPNAAASADTSTKPSDPQNKPQNKLNEFGLTRWQRALQQLNANDGSTGTASGHSIKHTD